MIVERQKARATLLARRTRAIIISLCAAALLVIGAVVINHFVRIYPFVDVDGTEYSVRYRKGMYGLYDEHGIKLDTDDEYSYFVTKAGTLVELDSSTGKTTIIAAVDTEGNEKLDHANRVLMFPHLEKKDISSLEVHNAHGSFTFLRYDKEADLPDNKGDFVIESSPLVSFDQRLFANLYVSAGYTLTTRKLEEPIVDKNGEFSEYGLVPETRIDDEGNEYLYEPAYYLITDIDGNRHKVIIGDKLVTGGGFYAQYVSLEGGAEEKRSAVYVLGSDIENSLLQPVESFVTPQIVYQMSPTDYTDVEDFNIFRTNDDGSTEHVVGFTFVPLDERQNSVLIDKPFFFTHEELLGYNTNADRVSENLNKLYMQGCERVCKLSPENADFIEYGLGREVEVDSKVEFEFASKYTMSYYYDILDDNGEYVSTIKQVVFISEHNEYGNYYAYTFVYEGHPESTNPDRDEELLYTFDMIVEVSGSTLDFVELERTDWINKNFVDYNIAFVDELTVSTKDYTAEFKLDNSKTPESENVSSSLLTVNGKDSAGNGIDTFSTISAVDVNGFVWTISAYDVIAVNSKGQQANITTAYYAYNKLGVQARCLRGFIECADGTAIKVTPDEIVVSYPNGEEEVFVRFATTLFRRFYQTLLVASIVDTYEMSEEEELALINNEDNLLLTMTLKDTDGVVKTFKFYRLTSRKAYITVNGTGGFYVTTDRVEKIVSDAQRFFALEPIDATTKN